ncbi:MAG: MetQ/NlpA family ABC transporter substrate-binding protein [Corynebacterium sp.]|nr:MetQ/NlpA family ABC transporter substrate-binding protein [Corynebacterium sp.]
MKFRRTIAALSAAALAATSLVACSSDSNDDDSNVIRIGTTDSAQLAWTTWVDLAAEKGITVETENFSDYNTPNDALAQGQIDANLFQHLRFLSEYNVGRGTDLAPVGSTEVVPLSLYWKDHDSLDGIEGEEIAVPNDDTNLSRALLALNSAGLVEFNNDDIEFPTIADIDTDASKVSVVPVDAAQTSVAHGEGRPAIINNTFLLRNGIDPKSAIFSDDPESDNAAPYINVLVTTSDRVDDEQLHTLIDLWHSPEVQEAVEEDSQGTSVEIQRSQEELQEILDHLEESAS